MSETKDIIMDNAKASVEITQVLTDKDLKAGEKHNEISKIVVGVLHGFGYFYHVMDKMEFGCVYYFDKKKKSLLTVQSDEFQADISERFGINRAAPVFKYVMAECETEGLSDRSTPIILSTFWESRNNKIYITNGPGTMVRISKNKIDVVDNGRDGVLFPKGSTLLPWKYDEKEAKDPFENCELFKTMSTQEKYMKTLFKVWACSFPTNPDCKPPLCATGPIGSGKTRLLIGLHELLGTIGSPEKCQRDKAGEEDFSILANRGGLLLLDNVDSKIPWLADAVATYSTGGSSEKRTLHTNSGITKLSPNAWCGLTSANPQFAADAGVSDRLLVVRLNRRVGETKEAALKIDILRKRSSGLSWICQILSKALNDNREVPGQLNARHPDFAEMAVRIGRQYCPESDIVEALRLAEFDKSTFNMENDDIGLTIKEYFEQTKNNELTGNAKEIVESLIEINPDLEGYGSRKGLTARTFGNRLKTILPHLQALYQAKIIMGSSNKKIYTFIRPGGKNSQTNLLDTTKIQPSEIIERAEREWDMRDQTLRGQSVITALQETKLVIEDDVFGITDSSFASMTPDQQNAIANYYVDKKIITAGD